MKESATRNAARRKRLGEFFFDVGKYCATIVVVGTLFQSDAVHAGVVAAGLSVTTLFLIMGWFIMPSGDLK